MWTVLGKAAQVTAKTSFKVGQSFSRSFGKATRSSYKRKSIWPIALFCLPFIVLGFIMFALFSNVEGEEGDINLTAYIVDSKTRSTSKMGYRYSTVIGRNEEGVEQSVIRDFSKVITNVTFNPQTDSNIQTLNLEIYRVTAKYMNSDVLKNIPAEWIDPLLIMSLANVESGTFADSNVIWTPAVPTIGNSNIDSSTIYNYGIKETLANTAYWNTITPYFMHQGPLQMSISYGVYNAAIPTDLQGSESTRTERVTLKDRYPGKNTNSLIAPSYAKTWGDRFNWPDAVNRSAGTMDYLYRLYSRDSNINKDGKYAIENRYSFVALMALNHNTGQSVTTLADGRSGGIFADISNARMYASVLGKQEVVDKIREEAKNKVKNYRNGGSLTIVPSNAYAQQIVSYLVGQNYISSNFYDSGRSVNYLAHRNYPIKVLHAYLVLEELYQGG